MKVGFCCLYGLANAGKSTLLNSILGVKVNAVSDTKQTTRENIQGIYNDDDSQIIFIDTPGLHSPHKRLGQLLLKDANYAKDNVDVVVYVVDSTSKVNEVLCSKLENLNIPLIVAFNKIDICDFERGQFHLDGYKKLLPKAEFVEMSALKKIGIDTLIEKVKSHLQEGIPLFPKNQLIDHPTYFVWAEMIREKCLNYLTQEVPHAIHVQIIDSKSSEDSLTIYADIIVEKRSEKAIVIGKKGQMISKIRRHAERSISIFMGCKVNLELYVKVVEDWRDNISRLKEYGYQK